MKDVRTFLAVGGVVALVGVGALVATLAGGGGGRDSANGSVPVDDIGQLAGPAWVVINDGSAPAAVVGTVRLEVSADGRVLAETGCNPVRGSVSVESSHLVTGPLMSTRMACEPALNGAGALGHADAVEPAAARAVRALPRPALGRGRRRDRGRTVVARAGA